jgi:hypothetical protein
MRKLLAFLFIILSFDLFPQGKDESIKYIPINSYNSSSLNISSIDDFLALMRNENVKEVFVTNTLFLIHGPMSVMYTINKNGYKNLIDLKAGVDKNFNDGNSYYFALENNLPNQMEVDYYKQEAYITLNDYKDATDIGFTHKGLEVNRIYGLVSREYLQNNLRYFNAFFFLRDYKDWQAFEPEPEPNPNAVYFTPSGRREAEQARDRARIQRQNKEREGLKILDNVDIDYAISISNAGIKKLKSFDYYLIDIYGEHNRKESFNYYLFKMSQYNTVDDFKNSNKGFTVKNTQSIFEQFHFNNLQDMLDADNNNILSGKDYYLMREYFITSDQLSQNRQLINELEIIKNQYLKDITKRSQNVFNIEQIGRDNYQKSDSKCIYAFCIYVLLKQEKNVPISYSNIVTYAQNNYQKLDIFRRIQFDENSVLGSINYINKVTNTIVNNPESKSFYIK